MFIVLAELEDDLIIQDDTDGTVDPIKKSEAKLLFNLGLSISGFEMVDGNMVINPTMQDFVSSDEDEDLYYGDFDDDSDSSEEDDDFSEEDEDDFIEEDDFSEEDDFIEEDDDFSEEEDFSEEDDDFVSYDDDEDLYYVYIYILVYSNSMKKLEMNMRRIQKKYYAEGMSGAVKG